MIWAQRQKAETIEWLQRLFLAAHKKDRGLTRRALESEICIKRGAAQRKAKEYIQELLNMGFIEEDEDGLWLSKKYQPLPEPEEDPFKALDDAKDGIE